MMRSRMDRDLSGRLVVITGANTGIGRATAVALAARGATLVLACRSEDKTRPVLDTIRAAQGDARFEALDLGDLASTRSCAARIRAIGKPVDVLLNNAGMAGKRGLTKDGFEVTFGVNHLGPFLFTVLLAPNLVEARGRIVNVSSKGHYRASGIDFDSLRKPTRSRTGLREYADTKLANVLFTKELARRIGPRGVHSYALHPGVVASDAWRSVPWPLRSLIKLFMISPEQGARTSVYCATSPDVAAHDGRYYDDCREKEPNPVTNDVELARRLWETSVALTGADLV
jgi:NAD(P)-dependent dehydrogenase (short-subunit alcohol dehydrogenase family)